MCSSFFTSLSYVAKEIINVFSSLLMTFISLVTSYCFKSHLRLVLKHSPLLSSSLGGGPDDAKEIMRHSFFSGVDWQDVYDKKVCFYVILCLVK